MVEKNKKNNEEIVVVQPEVKVEVVDTIEKLEEKVSAFLEIADPGITRLIIGNIVGNAMQRPPQWTMIVAPPSGGKSELLQCLYPLETEDNGAYVYPLSDLTTHTLMSGMQTGKGDASLLFDLDGKTLVMKDFTTIASLPKEERRQIMAQLREVYDGSYRKAFGTGKTTPWNGHVGFLAAITPKGVEFVQEGASMGERFAFYYMKQPDREKAQIRAYQNESSSDMAKLRVAMQDSFVEFLKPICDRASNIKPEDLPKLEEEFVKQILDICNFSSLARSPVQIDPKTHYVLFTHEAEMPMRLTKQVLAMAQSLAFVQGGKMKQVDKDICYKIALDSIPAHRREIIRALTRYNGGKQAAIGGYVGYHGEVVVNWLYELAAHKIIKRSKRDNKVFWEMEEKYRVMYSRYSNLPMEVIPVPDSFAPADDDDFEMNQALTNATPVPKQTAEQEAEMYLQENGEVELVEMDDDELNEFMKK